MSVEILDIIEMFFFGPIDPSVDVQEAWLGTVLSVGGSIVSGIVGGSQAKKRERDAKQERQRLERKMASFKRQPIINPYEGVTDLSSLAKDLSGQISNPYANLSVATKAAEMQIEQVDISLANTLDTLKASGASAGGATALAQAAMQSKKGVSASIEQQESTNEKLRAQGEQAMQQAKIAEKTRIQNAKIDGASRVQEAEYLGKEFMFNAQEERDLTELDRMQAQIDGQAARETQASADRNSINANMMSNIVTGLGDGIAGGVFGGGSKSSGSKSSAKDTKKTFSEGLKKLGTTGSGGSFGTFDTGSSFQYTPTSLSESIRQKAGLGDYTINIK